MGHYMEKQVIFKLKLGTSLQLQFVYKDRKVLLEGLFSLFSLGVEKNMTLTSFFATKQSRVNLEKVFTKISIMNYLN